MWETFNDSLNETQRQLESNRMQWSSFDDNYEQLMKWLADCESQSMKNIELKNTLQEKKSMMQHYRVRVANNRMENHLCNNRSPALNHTPFKPEFVMDP